MADGCTVARRGAHHILMQIPEAVIYRITYFERQIGRRRIQRSVIACSLRDGGRAVGHGAYATRSRIGDCQDGCKDRAYRTRIRMDALHDILIGDRTCAMGAAIARIPIVPERVSPEGGTGQRSL
jgi:hypothetical protein